jgi:hypothetical protein
MDLQAAAADGVAEAGDPGDHIDRQGRTEPLALMAFFDAQACQKGDGLGVEAGAKVKQFGKIPMLL